MIYTFDTATDPVTKKRYIYQEIDEADKNLQAYTLPTKAEFMKLKVQIQFS